MDVVGLEPTERGLRTQRTLAALLYEEGVALDSVEEPDVFAVIYHCVFGFHHHSTEPGSEEHT